MNAASDPPPSYKPGIALVGYGRMGRVYASLIDGWSDRMRLIAVADPVPEARAAAAEAHPTAILVDQADEALGRDAVDAVVVASPTPTHHDVVVAALNAGKAVLCEKPPALDLPDAEHLVEVAEASGRYLQIGFMRRFDAAYQDAWRRVRQGDIGEPLVVKCVGRDPRCPDPAFARPEVSGGLMVDMAIHDFDLARWFVGDEVVRVSAEGALRVCRDLAEVGDIDNALVNLRFADGTLGNVDVGRTAFYGYDIRMEVLGSEGAVQIGTIRHSSVTVLDRRGGHFATVPYLHDRFLGAYRAQLAALVDGVLRGTPPPVTARDGLEALRIAHAAAESHRLGRPVDMSAGAPAKPTRM